MAEPTITNSALIAEGTAGMSGNKIRSLTQEEIRMAKFVEESVRRELEERGPPQSTSSENKSVEMKPLPTLSSSSEPSNTAVVSSPPSQPTSPVQQQPTPVTNTASLPTPPLLLTPTPSGAIITPVTSSTSSSSTTVAKPPVQLKTSPPSTSIPSPSNQITKEKPILKRKLTKEELPIIGKALELAVKHRGGGPFGAGRFKDIDDIEQLSQSLSAAVTCLEEDSRLAIVVPPTAPVAKSTTASAVVKPPLPAAAPQPVPTIQKLPPPSPVVATHTMTESTMKRPMTPAAPLVPPPIISTPPLEATTSADPMVQQQVPIAAGIETFLKNPTVMDYEVINT
jgi:hypothetical protein